MDKDLLARIDANKAELAQYRPLEEPFLAQLRAYYRVGLTWTSNALEGNSLTETETKVVLEDGLTVGGRPLRDLYEAVGHGLAYDYMFSLIHRNTITLEDIRKLHQLFYREIDSASAGQWRTQRIMVTGTEFVFPSPASIDSHMQDLERWIIGSRASLHPVEFAALLHLKLVTIHPFIDGNGRTARLLVNLALLQSGYTLAVVPPLLRVEYLEAIRRYQNKGDANPFCDFIGERVLETQKDLLRMLRE